MADLARLDAVLAGCPAEHAALPGFAAVVFGQPWTVRAVLDRTVVVWEPVHDDVPRELHRFDEVFVDPACVRFVPVQRPDAVSRKRGRLASIGKAGRRLREATGG